MDMEIAKNAEAKEEAELVGAEASWTEMDPEESVEGACASDSTIGAAAGPEELPPTLMANFCPIVQ